VAGLEGFVLGEALGLVEEIADLGECCGALGRDATVSGGSGDGAEGVTKIRNRRGRTRKRAEFAEEIILAGGARGERAVGIAQAVEGGMRGHAAVAAVGKGEAAEV